MKTVLGLMFLVLVATVVFAQPPDSLWSRAYQGSHDESCRWLELTADGGCILGGYGGDFDEGEPFGNGWAVRVNAGGDSTWGRIFNACGEDYIYAVQPTADGGYLLVGTTLFLDMDLWLIKLNAGGEEQWRRTFGGNDCDHVSSMLPTSDGGYIIGGFTSSFGQAFRIHDFWLVKTDADSNVLWHHTYGTANDERCTSIACTDDGGYILGGYTSVSSSLPKDVLLVKTNAEGDSLWSRTFGGPADDFCYGVLQAADGGYLLSGTVMSPGTGSRDFWLFKTDENGDSLWSRTYGGTSRDECYALQPTLDGGFALAGFTESYGAGMSDFWLVKTDANGDSLWSRTFGGTGAEECYAMRQADDGSYTLAGYTMTFGGWGDVDFWLVRTAADPEAAEVEVPTPFAFTLSAYPNPFNPATELRFDLLQTQRVVLRVYDLLGREVARLADGVMAAGSHRVTFDGSPLTSGIYFATLEAGAESQTQKLVLLK